MRTQAANPFSASSAPASQTPTAAKPTPSDTPDQRASSRPSRRTARTGTSHDAPLPVEAAAQQDPASRVDRCRWRAETHQADKLNAFAQPHKVGLCRDNACGATD